MMTRTGSRTNFRICVFFALAATAVFFFLSATDACTNILVSRGASTDGSVFVSFSVDGTGAGVLSISPAGKKSSGEDLHPSITEWEGPTYKVLNHINEFQVSLGETTFTGRVELTNTNDTAMTYDRLMVLALQRCKTAREAIVEIDRLMQTYGYGSTGETLSIGDKNEVWLMEIMGKGEEKGAVWVAARVPDGAISAHANMSRITTFPLDDPENWLYSDDVVSFAAEQGFYDPDSGRSFSFRDAYHPEISKLIQRACAGRIWSIFRRAAPSQNFSSDYFRVVKGAEPYPLFLVPDKKISVHDVMQLMRDHYEETPWDMTKGVDAGPFGSPYRYRGLTFKIDDKNYAWERPISSQQAACVWIAQSRNWLPNPIGGVYWYTPDDAYTSCFAPFYVGITDVPKPYNISDYDKISRDSAWWLFNLVSNYAYDRYSRVIDDILEVQREQEQYYLEMMPEVDKMALALHEVDQQLMHQFLTEYGINTGNALFERWRQLYDQILTKNIDGYRKTGEDGPPDEVGYPEAWLREVVTDRGEELSVGDIGDH
jgi:dipeptidase